MGDHLGVGVGLKRIAQLDELFFLPLVVFDDAVVHHRHLAARDDGMRIALAHLAVGRPARMPDSGAAREPLALDRGAQVFDHPHAPDPAHFARFIQRHHARRVVASVFKLGQAVQQKGNDVFLRRDRADNAAHGVSFPAAAQRGRRGPAPNRPTFRALGRNKTGRPAQANRAPGRASWPGLELWAWPRHWPSPSQSK